MLSNVLKGLVVEGWTLYRSPLEKEGDGYDRSGCGTAAAPAAGFPISSVTGGAQEEARMQALREELEKERLQILDEARQEGEKIKEEAWREGYNAAVQQGQNESRLLREEADNLLREAQQERLALIKGAEAEILRIAVSIAEKLLHCKMIMDKNAVLAIFKKALEALPGGQNVILYLNPEDEAVCGESLKQLQEHLGKGSSLKIAGSTAIARGSCKVESEEAEIEINLHAEMETLANKLLALAGESKISIYEPVPN